MLRFVILNVVCSIKHAGQNQFYGLYTGFVMVAGGYGAEHISGGFFNTYLLVLTGFGWCSLYTIFEFLGAANAAVLFQVCRSEKSGGSWCPVVYEFASKVVSRLLGTDFLVGDIGLNVTCGSKAPIFSIAALQSRMP